MLAAAHPLASQEPLQPLLAWPCVGQGLVPAPVATCHAALCVVGACAAALHVAEGVCYRPMCSRGLCCAWWQRARQHHPNQHGGPPSTTFGQGRCCGHMRPCKVDASKQQRLACVCLLLRLQQEEGPSQAVRDEGTFPPPPSLDVSGEEAFARRARLGAAGFGGGLGSQV